MWRELFSQLVFKFHSQEQRIKNYVLTPITEAYDKVKSGSKIVTDKEDDITKKIVWYIKKESSITKLIEKRSIRVIMRSKEHVTIDELNEPDIQFLLDTKLWIVIEAKKMYIGNNWTSSEYTGERGLNRFLTDYYPSEDNVAGMLGYVQNGDLKKILINVKEGLSSKSFKSSRAVENINNCFVTIHCKNNGHDIKLYHLFLYLYLFS